MSADAPVLRGLDRLTVPLPLLIRWGLGGYFIYTGIHKLLDPVVFLKAIRLYHMLPETPAYYLNGSAVVVPWLEILCGAALVLGIARRGAALMLIVLLCVFTPAVYLRSLVVMREQGISFFKVAFDCGCGSGPQIIWIKLISNLGLFLLAAATLFSRYRRFSLESLFAGAGGAASQCRRCGAVLSNLGRCGCESALDSASPSTAEALA